MTDRPVTVSACLLGRCARFDDKSALSTELIGLVEGRTVIPVCPEEFGGLPTPRPRAWITNGDGLDVIEGRARVVNEAGVDVTDSFIKGAHETLRIMRLNASTLAYFKEKSPSCGATCISRDGVETPGKGVTAALLEKNGIEVKGFF